MPGLVLDHLDFGGWLLFELLAFPVFAVSVLWSLVHLLMQLDRDAWGPVGDCRRAAPALGLNAIALAVFLLPPCAQTVDHLYFWLHYSTRSTIVQAVQAGELQPQPLAGSGATVVSLEEHPWSVSRWGEEKRAAIYRDGEALQVVFLLPVRGRGGGHVAFVYRSDGRPPVRLLPGLPSIQWS